MVSVSVVEITIQFMAHAEKNKPIITEKSIKKLVISKMSGIKCGSDVDDDNVEMMLEIVFKKQVINNACRLINTEK